MLTDSFLSELQNIPNLDCYRDTETLLHYGHDETEDLSFPPHIVVKPATVEQVSAVLKIANQHQIPVVTIGGRTGLSGGALAVKGGIGLSMERFNQIHEIDLKNLQVTTGTAVVTQTLRDAVAQHGLFYPVDPSSQGSCFIGGNIAENAGGARALKYGVTKDYVLNLQAVLADGTIIETGANTLKNATGYNLTQLLVGSEGTLAVITRATLKLLPLPTQNVLMLVPFRNEAEACEAVSAVFRAGFVPSALEFMERDAIDWALQFVDNLNVVVAPDVNAHLLVELDGNNLDQLLEEAEKLCSVFEAYDIDDILFADSTEQKNQLWKMRRSIAEAVKANSVYKEEDTVVPRYALPELLQGIKRIGAKYGFKSVCYGHAGDGNLHVNIIRGALSEQQWQEDIPKGITEIFELTVALGGTLSGEHGIGYVQKNYMPIKFPTHHLDLMRGIKNVFDPNGILNPGKIFPDA